MLHQTLHLISTNLSSTYIYITYFEFCSSELLPISDLVVFLIPFSFLKVSHIPSFTLRVTHISLRCKLNVQHGCAVNTNEKY